MGISYELFLAWAQDRFGEEAVDPGAEEIKVNSIFDPNGDDTGHKLWCSPRGGPREREYGCYQCWITRRKGTLVGLVMEVDNCGFEEACLTLCAGGMDRVEEDLEEFFAAKRKEVSVVQETRPVLTLPEGALRVTDLPDWSRRGEEARSYLAGRKIPPDGLFYCGHGDYRDRVVIPYHDGAGRLIYYNGRYIGRSDRAPKYLGPPKEVGVGKGDVVFMPRWTEGGPLHVTEGEFDAMALSLCGLPSCGVGGSHLTGYQRRFLRGYRVCLCGDIDKPGAGAVFRAGMSLLEDGNQGVTFVRPPRQFKDWNEFFIAFPGELVARYIDQNRKPFNLITAEELFADQY